MHADRWALAASDSMGIKILWLRRLHRWTAHFIHYRICDQRCWVGATSPGTQAFAAKGLDDECKAVLLRSVEFRRKKDIIKSPEEKEITRRRKNILAKVYRSYTKLKREIYPELVTRFKGISTPPKPADEPNDEPADEPNGEPSEEPIDEPAEEPADEPAETPPRVARRQTPFETPAVSISSDFEDSDDVSINVPYPDDSSLKKILAPIDEIILDFVGVCGVVCDDYECVSTFLQSKDKVCIELPNLIEGRVYDYIICIPSEKNYITMHVSAIDKGIPFFRGGGGRGGSLR